MENIKIKEEILKIMEDHRPSYSYGIIKTALSKKEGIWKNVLTKIEILHKEEKRPNEERYDYEDFYLSKIILNLNDFGVLLDSIIKDGNLVIDDIPKARIEGSFEMSDWMRFIPSNDIVFDLNWSCSGYNFINSSKEYPPSGPFVSCNLPLFPNGHSAIKNLIGLDLSKYNQYCGSILIFLPNYKAKIQELRVGSKQLTLKIICKETLSKDVLGKIYIEGGFGTKSRQLDVVFEEEIKTISLDYAPQYIHTILLDRYNGEMIDERRFNLGWRELPPDVIFEISEEEIEVIIKRGENERIEFKEDVPKNTEELAETVVAFANTFGGTVFLGVTDNAETVGFSDPKGEEKIINILRSRCEPPINPIIEIKNIQEKPILLIRVNEGKDKPYTVRGKGPFIRCGSTDRIATRDELDEIYKKKNSIFLYR